MVSPEWNPSREDWAIDNKSSRIAPSELGLEGSLRESVVRTLLVLSDPPIAQRTSSIFQWPLSADVMAQQDPIENIIQLMAPCQ